MLQYPCTQAAGAVVSPPWGCAVAAGVVGWVRGAVVWGILKPRILPPTEVSVTSPPMISFLYTSSVAYTSPVAPGRLLMR